MKNADANRSTNEIGPSTSSESSTLYLQIGGSFCLTGGRNPLYSNAYETLLRF